MMDRNMIFHIDRLIKMTLEEDIGSGDVTTSFLMNTNQIYEAEVKAKGSFILAGLEVMGRVFQTLDHRIEMDALCSDGVLLPEGTRIALVRGPLAMLLCGERVALNFLQRLSGIATLTNRYVSLVRDLDVKIVDTRKTAPGFRALDKYAVRVGGGSNHRFGLYDGILIKDNHIKASGSIKRAVHSVRMKAPHTLKIEVETSTIQEVREAIECDVDIIMVDNMSLETIRSAVELIRGRALVEASGGITLENVRAVAQTGVDLISVGEITHSVKAPDISMKLLSPI